MFSAEHIDQLGECSLNMKDAAALGLIPCHTQSGVWW